MWRRICGAVIQLATKQTDENVAKDLWYCSIVWLLKHKYEMFLSICGALVQFGCLKQRYECGEGSVVL